jgi:bacteriocin biosynthesis cyclodehydratase domain-containing protein
MLLEHGRSTVSFAGAAARQLLPALLPLLDGEHTVDEIVEAMGRAAEPAVENALALLMRHGLLTDGPPLERDASDGLRRTTAYLAQASPDSPQRVAERLATARVWLEGDPALRAAVTRLLRRSGLARAHSESEATFIVSGAALAGDPDLDRRNAVALETGCDWLPLGCFDGRAASVGPLVVPGETACYRCLVLRRDGSTACAAELASLRGVPCGAPVSPTLLALVAAIAAERVLRWIGLRDPALPGTVVTCELVPELVVADEVVLRVPRCTACSSIAAAGEPLPWHEATWERP